jgi:hypothetical protein
MLARISRLVPTIPGTIVYSFENLTGRHNQIVLQSKNMSNGTRGSP